MRGTPIIWPIARARRLRAGRWRRSHLTGGCSVADFALVRPPIGEFMALGGMMVGRDDIEPLARPFASAAAFQAAASLLWRHATDRLRYRRGTRLLMGNALVARLFYSLRRARRSDLAECSAAGAHGRGQIASLAR